MTGPRLIETERLLLRPVTLRDCWFFVRLLGNPKTRRYLGGPVPALHALRRFRDHLGAPQRSATWMACLAAGGRPIGLVALGRHKDGADHELSYQFDPEMWGKGYAQEAARSVLGYALGDAGLSHVIAETQSMNGPSCRLLHRLGMEERTRVFRFGAEQIIFCTRSPGEQNLR